MRVVALHGFLGQPDVFTEVSEHLGCSLDAPPLPGHGPEGAVLGGSFESTVDAWLGPWVTPDTLLLGYSMGARLALSYALRHRVRGAVLLSASPGLSSPEARAARRGDDARLAESLEREGLAAFVTRWEAQPLFASQRGLAPTRLAAHRARRLGHRPAALASALRVLGTGQMPDCREALARRAVPLVWAVGALDTKFVGIAEALVAAGALEGYTRVEGAGHDLVLEAPETVARLVRQLAEQTSG
ncbi:MAG: alpha/beta fold hydrolase [Myxococcales bacterium]|nr:alpha/beta fold hydrolase [Myxococcales bacterium]